MNIRIKIRLSSIFRNKTSFNGSHLYDRSFIGSINKQNEISVKSNYFGSIFSRWCTHKFGIDGSKYVKL